MLWLTCIVQSTSHFCPATHAYTVYLPFTSGIPDFGSDGVRCFTRDDVRGRVEGFVGEDSVLKELLA